MGRVVSSQPTPWESPRKEGEQVHVHREGEKKRTFGEPRALYIKALDRERKAFPVFVD